MERLSLRLMTVVLAATATVHVAWASPATDHMQRAQDILSQDATPHAVDMARHMRVTYDLGRAIAEVGTAASAVESDLQRAQRELNAALSTVVSSEYTTLYPIMVDYYRVVGRLYVVKSAMDEHEGVDSPLTAFTHYRLRHLRLSAPVAVAQNLRDDFVEMASVDNNSMGIPNITLTANEHDDNNVFVEFSPIALHVLSAEALRIYPSERLARNRVNYQGLATKLSHQMDVRAHMRPSERPTYEVPEGAATADETLFMEFQRLEGTALNEEVSYRKEFLPQVAPLMLDWVSPNSPELRRELLRLVHEARRTFSTHIDGPKVRGFPAVNLPNLVGANLTAHYGRTMAPALMSSAQRFHELRGEALAQALRNSVAKSLGALTLRLLGCLNFQDRAGAQSNCFSGDAPAQIYTQWTAREIADLDNMMRETVNRIYTTATMPASISALASRLQTSMVQVNASKRRYLLAAKYIEGAEVLAQIAETKRQIEVETGISFNEEALLPRDRRSRISPSFISTTQIVPGYVVLALNLAGFENAPAEMAPWYANVLSSLAASADQENVDDQQRLSMRSLLIDGTGLLSTDLTNQVNRVSSDLGEISELIGAHDEHSIRMESVCAHPGIDNFFECMVTWLGWLWQTGSSAGTRVLSADAEPVPLGSQLIITPNAMLEHIASLLQLIRSFPRTSHLSFDLEIEELKRRLVRPGIANAAASPEEIFIQHFEDLLHTAELIHSDSLTAQIKLAFTELTTRFNALPFITLQRQVAGLQPFLESQRSLIDALFESPERRTYLLREILTDRLVYEYYLVNYIQSMERRLPGLYDRLAVPSFVTASNPDSLPDGIPLYRIIQALRVKSRTPFVITQIREAQRLINGGERGDILRDRLEQPVTQIDLRATVADAMGREDPSMSLMDRQFISLNNSRLIHSSQESWWPDRLTFSEILPTLRDEVLMSSCTSTDSALENIEDCKDEKRRTRALVSAVLSPYLKAAYYEDQRGLSRILNGTVDGALIQSDAITNGINEDTGGFVGGALAREEARQTFWRHWLEETRGRLSGYNHGAFSLFMLTQLVHQESITHQFHSISGMAMFFPAMTELGIEMAQASIYSANFHDLRAISGMSVVGAGLISSVDIESLRERYVAEMGNLTHRLPMDLMWMHGTLTNWIGNSALGRRLIRMWARHSGHRNSPNERLDFGGPEYSSPYTGGGPMLARFPRSIRQRHTLFIEDCRNLDISPAERDLATLDASYAEALRRVDADGGSRASRMTRRLALRQSYRRLAYALRASEVAAGTAGGSIRGPTDAEVDAALTRAGVSDIAAPTATDAVMDRVNAVAPRAPTHPSGAVADTSLSPVTTAPRPESPAPVNAPDSAPETGPAAPVDPAAPIADTSSPVATGTDPGVPGEPPARPPTDSE